MPEDIQSEVQTVFMDNESVEFQASYRNPHGTGYDIIVSNPIAGNVDIELFQVVCHEVPNEPSVSLSLPLIAAHHFLSALQGGVNVAYHVSKLKRYH